MSPLEERLEALLSSPGGHGQDRPDGLPGSWVRLPLPAAPPPEAEPDGQGDLLGMVGRIVRGLKDSGGKRQLLAGLAPYLADSRRRRLEKALRLASAARLAGAALAEMGEDDGI